MSKSGWLAPVVCVCVCASLTTGCPSPVCQFFQFKKGTWKELASPQCILWRTDRCLAAYWRRQEGQYKNPTVLEIDGLMLAMRCLGSWMNEWMKHNEALPFIRHLSNLVCIRNHLWMAYSRILTWANFTGATVCTTKVKRQHCASSGKIALGSSLFVIAC